MLFLRWYRQRIIPSDLRQAHEIFFVQYLCICQQPPHRFSLLVSCHMPYNLMVALLTLRCISLPRSQAIIELLQFIL